MKRKVKYDYAFKLECVKLVLEKHYSTIVVSKQKGVAKSNIQKWVNFYLEYGKSGIQPKKNNKYSLDFKIEVIKAIKQESLSLNRTCLRFNVPEASIIFQWKKKFDKFGIEGLKNNPKGRPKIMSNFKRSKRKSDKPLTREEELLKEIEILRCENDLLKKFHALIQAEEKAKKRKP